MLGDFGLDGRGDLYRVGPDSPLVGQRLRDLKLAQSHQLWVIGVERQERLGSTIEAAPGPDTVIRAGDVLIVHATAENAARFAEEAALQSSPVRDRAGSSGSPSPQSRRPDDSSP